MDVRIRRVIKGLFWLGVVLFLGNMIGGWIIPSFDAHNDANSAYMRFLDDHTIIYGIAWLGSLGCGLCGLVSLFLTALARRLGYSVDVPRFYILVPLLLCLVWFVMLTVQLGQAR